MHHLLYTVQLCIIHKLYFTLVNYTSMHPFENVSWERALLHLELIKCYYCSFLQHFNTVIHTCLPTQCDRVWGTKTSLFLPRQGKFIQFSRKHNFSYIRLIGACSTGSSDACGRLNLLLAVWFDADTENRWFTEWDVENRATDGQCITCIWFQTDNNNTDIRNRDNIKYTVLQTFWICIIMLPPPVFNHGGSSFEA